MSVDDFLRDLHILEGGYTVDKGGPTEFGITQSTYDDYCSRYGLPSKNVRTLGWSDVRDFYDRGYITPLRLIELPYALAFVLFQWAVDHEGYGNHGQVVRDFQVCCGAEPDGIIGPETIAAANAILPMKLASCVLSRQEAWYKRDSFSHPDDPIRGWIRRIEKTREIVGLPNP